MAAPHKKTVSHAEIRVALREAVEDFLDRVEQDHPGETSYGILLVVDADQFNVSGAVGTDEGLLRFARTWVAGGLTDKDTDTVEKACTFFRGGNPEDALVSAARRRLPPSP